MSQSVLIVEDDRDIQRLLTITLSQAGFSVDAVRTVAEALAFTKQTIPDIAVIDWMLPQGSGIQLIQHLRNQSETSALPILLLTAKQEEHDKLMAFERGADDYLTKPFSSKELVARLNALLRRAQRSLNNSAQNEADQHSAGPIRLDLATHRVTVQGQDINLNPTEFRLLHFFMTHRDRVYSRAQILDLVWGYNATLEERTVDVHIRRLRKALEPFQAEALIETVRSVGYRFNADALA